MSTTTGLIDEVLSVDKQTSREISGAELVVSGGQGQGRPVTVQCSQPAGTDYEVLLEGAVLSYQNGQPVWGLIGSFMQDTDAQPEVFYLSMGVAYRFRWISGTVRVLLTG